MSGRTAEGARVEDLTNGWSAPLQGSSEVEWRHLLVLQALDGQARGVSPLDEGSEEAGSAGGIDVVVVGLVRHGESQAARVDTAGTGYVGWWVLWIGRTVDQQYWHR